MGRFKTRRTFMSQLMSAILASRCPLKWEAFSLAEKSWSLDINLGKLGAHPTPLINSERYGAIYNEWFKWAENDKN